MTEREISACCYSEKADVSIGFGIFFDSDEESIDTLDTEWIDVGMSESFWENHFEFEPGIEKAKQLVENNSNLTFRQALYTVFGDFSISYEVDCEALSEDWCADIDADYKKRGKKSR